MIGEMSAMLKLIDSSFSTRRSATATAYGHTECSLLKWAQIEALLEQYPEEKDRVLGEAKRRHELNLEAQKQKMDGLGGGSGAGSGADGGHVARHATRSNSLGVDGFVAAAASAGSRFWGN